MIVQSIVNHDTNVTPSKPFPAATPGTVKSVRVVYANGATIQIDKGTFVVPSNDFDLGEVDVSTLLVSNGFPILSTFITY